MLVSSRTGKHSFSIVDYTDRTGSWGQRTVVRSVMCNKKENSHEISQIGN